MSENELLGITRETLMSWAREEAYYNDNGCEEMAEQRYSEMVETYLDALKQTLNGEYQ